MLERDKLLTSHTFLATGLHQLQLHMLELYAPRPMPGMPRPMPDKGNATDDSRIMYLDHCASIWDESKLKAE